MTLRKKHHVKIGFIPGALDTLSGEYFPHFLHMQENIRALMRRADVALITARKANAWYVRFQGNRFYSVLNRCRPLHPLRKLLNLLFFLVVSFEVRRRIRQQENDIFLVRFCLSNCFIARYLHINGHRILLEVHALAHVEAKEYGQSYAPPFYFGIVRQIEKKMLDWADCIYTVSNSLKRSLTNLGVDERRIHVIPNAVDPLKFNHLRNGWDVRRKHGLLDKTVVGFVGSFARYHGVGNLLDLSQKVAMKYPNVAFLLVGKNVHGYDRYVSIAAEAGISGMFVFAGEVPHSKVPSYIAAMDIAIIPDFNTYGSPMKLFEYMGMGKAVIAPGVPPIREIVEHGKTAILFERGNTSQALAAIEQLVENEELRRQLGERGRIKVTNQHTWDRNAERIVRMAEDMV